jgi:hypothetical protein
MMPVDGVAGVAGVPAAAGQLGAAGVAGAAGTAAEMTVECTFQIVYSTMGLLVEVSPSGDVVQTISPM